MTGRGAVRAARQARHGRLGMARIGLVREARQAWRHIAAPGGNGSAWRGYATITVMEAESITFTRFELGQLYAALGATQLSKLSPDLRAKLRGEFRRLEDESTPVLVPIKLATERPDDESMHSADA